MPFYSFKLESPDAPDNVLTRIGQLMRPVPAFSDRVVEAVTLRDVSSKPFLGKVSGTSFKCHRDIRYRNSFLPVVSGEVLPAGSGSSVQIRMRLNYFVMVFMAIWVGIAGVSIFHYLAKPGTPAGAALASLAGLALMLAGFAPEAIKAKRLLAAAVAPNNSFKPKPLRGSA